VYMEYVISPEVNLSVAVSADVLAQKSNPAWMEVACLVFYWVQTCD